MKGTGSLGEKFVGHPKRDQKNKKVIKMIEVAKPRKTNLLRERSMRSSEERK